MIPLETLATEIERSYDIRLHSLDFRAKGWGGISYIAETIDGNRYFVKLQSVAGPEWASAPNDSRFYLPLLHQLHAQNLIKVPRLVLTAGGAYSVIAGEYEMVLYEFIDGKVVGFGQIDRPILARLAVMVGRLHASTPGFKFQHEFHETYELGVEQDLLRSLDRLADSALPLSSGEEMLRANLPSIREPILAHLDRFRAIQTYARHLDKPHVICHTDLHGGNLMFDENGDLVLLDWENAMLAPPEHDLYFIAGEPEFREVFLPGYERAFGLADPDPDLLGFYWYRRAFEDVAGFLTRIQTGDGTPDRDREDVEMLLENIAWLDRIDEDVSRFRIDQLRLRDRNL